MKHCPAKKQSFILTTYVVLCTGVFQKPHRYYFSNIRTEVLLFPTLRKQGQQGNFFFQRHMGRVRFEPTERSYYLHCLQREYRKHQHSTYTSYKVDDPRTKVQTPDPGTCAARGSLLPSAHLHILAVGFCLLACLSHRTSPHTSVYNAQRWGDCPWISSHAFLYPVEVHLEISVIPPYRCAVCLSLCIKTRVDSIKNKTSTDPA